MKVIHDILHLAYWIVSGISGFVLLTILIFTMVAYHELGYLPDHPSDFSIYGHWHSMSPPKLICYLAKALLSNLDFLFPRLGVYALFVLPITIVYGYYQLFTKPLECPPLFFLGLISMHLHAFMFLQSLHGIGVEIYCFNCWYWD